MERQPLLWAALLAVAAIVFADGPGPARWAAGGLLGIGFLCLFLTRRPGLCLLALVASLSAGGLHAWRIDRQHHALEASLPHLETSVKIVTPPKPGGRGWSAIVRDREGALWWFRGAGDLPAEGAQISSGGNFSAISAPRNPGEFDFRDWAWRKGLAGAFSTRGPEKILDPPSAFAAWTTRVREGFAAAIVAGLDPAAPEVAVIRGMLLGEVPADPAIADSFRYSGILHAFSVSGLHIEILVIIGGLLLRLIGVPWRYAILVLTFAAAAYVWLTGFSMPATRAFIMAAVVFAAFFLRRRSSIANTLGLALLGMTLLDGHLVFHPGVQLSFGVVAAIAFIAPLTLRLFAWIRWMEPYLPATLYSRRQRAWLWLRSWVARSFSVSSAAIVGSLPILVLRFGIVSWISILSCVALGPLIFSIMAVAFLSASLTFLPSVSLPLNRFNFHLASASLRTAAFTSSIPGGHFHVPLDRPGKDFLIVYDPGNGGGAALLYDDGAAALFDAAQDRSFKNILAPSLQRLVVAPQTVVLSHPDSGHVGGAPAALDSLPIHQVVFPVVKARSPAFKTALSLSYKRGMDRFLGDPGDRYPISAHAELEIIHVAGPELAQASADQRVMVTRLHWRGWRILFTSDTGWSAEQAMLASGVDLSADVIVMGRNAHDGSGSDAFLASVHPQAIVAAHSDFPLAARIPQAWLDGVESTGIKVLHQGRTGAVSIIPHEKDGTLELRGFVDGSSLILHH